MMDERTRFWVLCGAVIAVVAILALALFGGGGEGSGPGLETAAPVAEPASDSGGDFAEVPAPLAEPAAVSREGGLAGSRAAAGSIRRDASLKGSGRIMGVVRRSDGSPAAGAAVTAWRRRAGDWAGHDGEAARHTATADSDGRFAVAGAGDGIYLVRAEDGDLAGTQRATIQGGSAVEVAIVLNASGRFAGRVVDASGAPVAGAWVRAASGAVPQHEAWGNEPYGAETDGEGAFALIGMADKAVRLVAEAEGFAPSASEEMTPTRENVELILDMGGGIAGTVRDADTGEAAAGVPLRFTGAAFAPVEVTSGPDGRFAASLLAAGAYFPSISGGPYRITGDRAPVEVAAGETAERDVTVTLGGAVAGVVVRKPGMEPVSGVTVAAYPREFLDETGDHRRQSNATGADGTFVIEGLAAGQYTLEPQGPGAGDPMRQTWVNMQRGDRIEGLEIALPAMCTVEGVVLDEAGGPAKGAIVKQPFLQTGGHAVADEQGRFIMSGVVRTAEVAVYATLGPRRSQTEGPLVFDDSGVARIELRLQGSADSGAIEGTVVDHGGRGVKGAEVTIDGTLGFDFINERTTTGDDGRFVFDALPSGSYFVDAQKTGVGHAYRNTPIPVGVGERVTSIELRFGAVELMDVAGVVLDETGRPAAGAEVLGFGPFWYAKTDGRGAFTLEKVYGDAIQVVARHEELGFARESYNPIRSGITLRLKPPQSVHGRVVDGSTGRPVTRFAVVESWSESRPAGVGGTAAGMASFADPEGRFVYNTEERPLEYIAAWAEGYAYAVAPVNPAGETVVSLVPERRVSGRVTDSQGHGVAGAALFIGRLPNEVDRRQSDAVLSDASGAFLLRDVAPEATLIAAFHGAYGPGSAAIPPTGDANGVTVQLTGKSALRVRFHTEGWPREGSRMVAVQSEWANEYMTPDADGTALFEGLAPGEYRVAAGWSGPVMEGVFNDRWSVTGRAVVSEGRTTEADLVLLPRNAAVEGVVTRGGAPASGVRIEFRGSGEDAGGAFIATSGEDGWYRIDPMVAAAYVVRARVRPDAAAWNGAVELVEGAGVRFDIDLDVPFDEGGEGR